MVMWNLTQVTHLKKIFTQKFSMSSLQPCRKSWWILMSVNYNQSKLQLMPNLGVEFIFKSLAGVTVLIDRAVSRVRVIKSSNNIQNTPRVPTTCHFIMIIIEFRVS